MSFDRIYSIFSAAMAILLLKYPSFMCRQPGGVGVPLCRYQPRSTPESESTTRFDCARSTALNLTSTPHAGKSLRHSDSLYTGFSGDPRLSETVKNWSNNEEVMKVKFGCEGAGCAWSLGVVMIDPVNVNSPLSRRG